MTVCPGREERIGVYVGQVMDKAATCANLMSWIDRPEFWHDLAIKCREREEKSEQAIKVRKR